MTRNKIKFSFLFLLLLIIPFSTFAEKQFDFVKIKINNHVITNNEIEIRIYEEAKKQKLSYPDAPQLKKMREIITDNLIEETLLDIKADELMINISDAALDTEIDNFRKQNRLSKVEFENYLEKQKISLTFFRNNYLKRYRRNRVIDLEIRSFIQIDEKDVKDNYLNSPDANLKINALHILKNVSKDADEKTQKKILDDLLKIKSKILSGLDFSRAAKKYSEDPSAKINGGNLGFFEKGDMVKEFADVAFKLPLNKISDPVKTIFGYHIIKVIERKKSAPKPFDEVKSKLMKKAYQLKFVSLYQDYIKKLKKKTNIEIR